MILYIDTSALAKLYVDEAGTAAMLARVQATARVASSVLAWPECLALLARRHRDGLLTAPEYDQLRARFHEDYADLWVVELDGRVVELVDEVVRLHPLRSADAVHLASALRLREAGLVVEFACSDRALLAAARAARLTAFDPAEA